MGRRRGLVAAFGLLCALADVSSARADDVAQAIAWLDSDSSEQVQLGIETLGLAPSARGAVALTARARRGLPPELLLAAISTLGAMQQREAVPYLVELGRHRRTVVRAKALEALAAIGGDEAKVALRRGLDDGDADVRVAAVRGLGLLQDRSALQLLVRAFDRGVTEAGDVLGLLGGADEIRFLMGQLGHVPLQSLLSGLGEALRRADLPQRLRLDIVARLTEMATVEVRTFFESVAPNLPGPTNDPVRRAVSDAIVRISG